MDLREYLSIVDAIPAARTRDEVVAILTRILAADLHLVERRFLSRQLAGKARSLGSSLGVEVIRELLTESSKYEAPRLTRLPPDPLKSPKTQ